jgi:Glycosyl transferase family 2.
MIVPTDKFDYKFIANKYPCIYVKNKERLGVAKSRDLGVSMSNTEYFLLLDGHMRFYDKGWDIQLLEYLKNTQEV